MKKYGIDDVEQRENKKSAPIPETRPSLILRLQKSEDQLAWLEFLEIYQPLILSLARRQGFQMADAQDVLQDVLVRVSEAIHQWEPDPAKGSFRGWLSRITRNLVIDHFRKVTRQAVVTGESTHIKHFTGRELNEAALRLEERRRLFHWAALKAKQSVSDKTWNAFWITAVQQRSPHEAAVELSMNIGAVYVSRSRVLAKIKHIIEQSQFDNPDRSPDDEH